jgi:hypothetical protein
VLALPFVLCQNAFGKHLLFIASAIPSHPDYAVWCNIARGDSLCAMNVMDDITDFES